MTLTALLVQLQPPPALLQAQARQLLTPAPLYHLQPRFQPLQLPPLLQLSSLLQLPPLLQLPAPLL